MTDPPLVPIGSNEPFEDFCSLISSVRREFMEGNSVRTLLDGDLTLSWFQEPELQATFEKLERVIQLTWSNAIRRKDLHAFLAAVVWRIGEERAAVQKMLDQGFPVVGEPPPPDGSPDPQLAGPSGPVET